MLSLSHGNVKKVWGKNVGLGMDAEERKRHLDEEECGVGSARGPRRDSRPDLHAGAHLKAVGLWCGHYRLPHSAGLRL